MKNDRFNLIVRISLILIIVNFVTFYETNAFLTDSQKLSTNISIATGTLDIELKDSSHNTVGDKSYYLHLDQATKSQTIGNLSVMDIGTLSSNLSARVLFEGSADVVKNLKVMLTDSNGNKISDLSGTFIMVNSIHNTETPFGVKISYMGSLPFNSSDLVVKVELRATQPNDNFLNGQMFTDKEEIRFVMPKGIQIAFGDGIPIEGTIIIKHNETIFIDLLPKGLDIKTVDITVSDNRYRAEYDRANQRITVYVKGVGNNNIVAIKITITLQSGEIYIIEREIQSTN